MNLRKIAVSCVVGSCLVVGTVAAANKNAKNLKGDAANQQMMETYMKLATPGENHAHLKPLEGEWMTTVKSWMGTDQMSISEGTCQTSWVMNGRYLKEECTGNFNGAPFTGMGLTGYDNMSKKYVSSWIDNMGTGIMMANGSIDSAHKKLTFTSMAPDPMTGKPEKMRMVTKIVDNNKHILSMYSAANGKEALVMEITYTRK